MNLNNFYAYGFFLLFFLISGNTCGQTDNKSVEDADSVMLADFLDDLYSAGVSMTEDSVRIDEESFRLLNDEQYRTAFYPDTYTWEASLNFLKIQEFKKGFWYLINLSMNNEFHKNLVVKTILTYDLMFDMDKALISAFYTYCYMDPSVGSIEDGKPNITAPHILEQKLEAVKEILHFVEKYKAENEK